MKVWECLYTRRSERRFLRGKEIPEKDIKRILDSARYAWSPWGAPPWRLLLIKDGSTKELLASFAKEVAHRIFGTSYEIFRGHLWYLPEDRVPAVAEYAQSGELWTYPLDCSFIVVPVISKGAFSDQVIYGIENICALSTGMALQNMWLVAHSLGYGAACNAMPLNDIRRREIFYEHCGIPSSWQTLGAFSVGYSSQKRMVGPSRAPLEGIVFQEVWGRRYRRSFGEALGEIEDADVEKIIREVPTGIIKFDPERKVEKWKIERILDTARWAPNPENLNHWRHVVIKSRETKSWIAELTKEGIQTMGRNMEDLLSHFYWLEERRLEFIEWLLQEGWKFPSECDIIILTCFGRQWAEYAHAVGIIPGGIDYIWSSATGCAVQNMRIAAKTLELETMLNIFPVGELRRAELLAEELGIPQTWVPCSMLCVGYPREKLSGRPLPEMTSLVWNEYWGVSYEN